MQKTERNPVEEAKILKKLIEKSMRDGTPLESNSEKAIEQELEKKRKINSLREYVIQESVADSIAHKAFKYWIKKESNQ